MTRSSILAPNTDCDIATTVEFACYYPRLYRLTPSANVKAILRHGLFITSAPASPAASSTVCRPCTGGTTFDADALPVLLLNVRAASAYASSPPD
jgi:hypothetical protein